MAAAAPTRPCVACRKRLDQSQLLRFSLQADTAVEHSHSYLSGRSIYVCPGKCFEAVSAHLGGILTGIKAKKSRQQLKRKGEGKA